MSNCLIRPAADGDSGAVSALAFRSKAVWGYSVEQMELFRAELSFSEQDLLNSRCPTFVAERDGCIAGFCRVDLGLVDHSELDALYVDPGHMRSGVGVALLDHARAVALASGFRMMMVQSDPNATAFYLARGGVEVGVRESGSVAGRYLPLLRIMLTD